MGFEVSKDQAWPGCHCHFLLPRDPGVEFSDNSPPSCLPVCHHASCCANNRLNLWTCSPVLVKCFPFQELPLWCLFIAIEALTNTIFKRHLSIKKIENNSNKKEQQLFWGQESQWNRWYCLKQGTKMFRHTLEAVRRGYVAFRLNVVQEWNLNYPRES